MSENTQQKEREMRSALMVRSGALVGPARYLQTELSYATGPVRSELLAILHRPQMETLMHAEDFLLGLVKLDRLAPNQDAIAQAALAHGAEQLGLFGKCLTHSETLWDALSRLREIVRYFQSSTELRFKLKSGKFHITYVHPFGHGPEAKLDVKYAISLLISLIREAVWYKGCEITCGLPDANQFRRSLLPEMRRISDSQVGFVSFDEMLLRSPLKRGNVQASGILGRVLSSMTASKDHDPSLTDLVNSMLEASLAEYHQPVSLKLTSYLLDIPERTLQAKLAVEGEGFLTLRDTLRHSIAREALVAGRSIAETAEQVGFKHRQSFSEAFSVWEGCAPSEFVSRGNLGEGPIDQTAQIGRCRGSES